MQAHAATTTTSILGRSPDAISGGDGGEREEEWREGRRVVVVTGGAVFLHHTVGRCCGHGGGSGGGDAQAGRRGFDGAFVQEIVRVKRCYSYECVRSLGCKRGILPVNINRSDFVRIDSLVLYVCN